MNKQMVVRPCPKCHIEKKMTKHHVFPKRHFGTKDNKKVFLLCRDCHDKLERLIPFEVMPKEFYPAVIKAFLLMEESK